MRVCTEGALAPMCQRQVYARACVSWEEGEGKGDGTMGGRERRGGEAGRYAREHGTHRWARRGRRSRICGFPTSGARQRSDRPINYASPFNRRFSRDSDGIAIVNLGRTKILSCVFHLISLRSHRHRRTSSYSSSR